VKRYVAEPGSDLVRETMSEADSWFMCRVGYVETARAVGLAAGSKTERRFREEWSSFGVIEVDQPLVEAAAALTQQGDLRSLDALHLASALLLPTDEVAIATYDRRLHTAATSRGLRVIPADAP
jgi:predicted nucleic acid-binding protein